MESFNHVQSRIIVRSANDYGRIESEHVGADSYIVDTEENVGMLEIKCGDQIMATYAPGCWGSVLFLNAE